MAWVEKRGRSWRVRYQCDDGSIGSESGFPTKTAATARAEQIDTDRRRHTFIDPRAGQVTLREWVAVWRAAHHAAPSTLATYDSHLRTHILPRFGDTPLHAITRMAIRAWAHDLRGRLKERSVIDVVRLLATILNEAVEERLIPLNPCRRLRLGKPGTEERPVATADELLDIADRATHGDPTLIITAAYSGMRWGELAGLRCRRSRNSPAVGV